MSRRGWVWLLIIVSMSGLAASIASTVSVDYGFDAMVYTELSVKYADSWAFFNHEFYDQSPPLRYVPYAILIELADPKSYESTFRLTTLLAAIITYVCGALTSYELGRAWHEDTADLFGVVCIGIFLGTAFVWPGNRFFGGKWQYTTMFPLLIVSLLVARRALQENRAASQRYWAVVTGLVIGLLGLQQITTAAVASLAIGGAYFLYRQWGLLLLTGATGASLGSLLFLDQSEAQSQATGTFNSRFFPESGTITIATSKFATIGVVLILLLLIITAVLAYWKPTDRPITTLTDMLVVVLAIGWAVTGLTTAVDYFSSVMRYPLIYFVVLVSAGRIFPVVPLSKVRIIERWS